MKLDSLLTVAALPATVSVVTLGEICENARLLATAHGWDQTNAAVRMLHVTSEVGEVADALIALQNAADNQVGGARTALGHEIYDAIWNLCALANCTGIDLEEAARHKSTLNESRGWPERSS